MKTGEVKEYTMSWKDLDQFKKDNPNLQQQILPPSFITRTDGGKEVQQKVKEGLPERYADNIKTK